MLQTTISLAELLQAFFAAMKVGWASGAVGRSVGGLPGARLIEWHDGVWSVQDLYWVTVGGDFSYGLTTICFDGQPVWRMSYEGAYPRSALPFLRAALRQAYENDIFHGGRGPASCLAEGYIYYNELESPDTMGVMRFRCTEFILFDGKRIGGHVCNGGIVLPAEYYG